MQERDAFAAVAALPGVTEAAASARAALDPLLLDRRLRSAGPQLAAEAAFRNAQASATLEGAEVPDDELRRGLLTSPLLCVAGGILELQRGLRTWQDQPPRQVWAALAATAGREYLVDELRGRPRSNGDELHDPLHLGLQRDAGEVGVRLALLAELLHQPTSAPALVVAALAHGELLALQPFAAGNGVVARAFSHLLLAQRGVDPDLLAMTDVGLASLGRATYVRAIQAYDSGRPEAVAAWCIHLASAFERGAVLARQTLDSLT
ncbi:MAG: Fic family protein [Candidatus Nanopelagicales bacterium]